MFDFIVFGISELRKKILRVGQMEALPFKRECAEKSTLEGVECGKVDSSVLKGKREKSKFESM